ncbi:prolyl oligopeptidase family serine peptidase [Terracidiphilus gabretensis]|uniref:prolyl oligopeptidase family serine peptidase n=1 Tax=Terracidiphilus gabretensis TaxID=1577687 RepID=UPI00071B60C8|nr:prolyl oligopeptidase family serine peptidase [Terracidiphilus gabretensis]
MRPVAAALIFASTLIPASAQAIHGRDNITLPAPPATQSNPVFDNYFGTKIVDNYRWLEDAKSPDTRAYIEAQNAYTQRYLKQAHIRSEVVDDLDALEHVARWSTPIDRNGALYFTKRLAGEEQSSIYIRRTYTGPVSTQRDERLIDPAQLSRDPNTSVSLSAVSHDGTLLIYGLRQGGADETALHVYNVKTGKTLEDELPAGLYRSVAFTPDNTAFFYTIQKRTGTLLYEHKLGERPTRDELLFGHEFRGEPLGPIDLFSASVTDDQHYLVVTVNRGVPARRVDIVFKDLTKPASGKPDTFFEPLIWGVDSRFSAIRAENAWYVLTDYKAPNYRLMKADPGIVVDSWTQIIPESTDVTDDFSIAGNKIYLRRLHDVQSDITTYTLAGKPAGKVSLDGIGTASGISGRPRQRYAWFSFESFIQPPTLYRLDTLTGKHDIFAQPKIPFNPAEYTLKQAFYTSKDGTKIPIFIAGKKGIKQDGSIRLLMSGYGGFNLSMTPHWNPEWAWWMSQGGWFALPNMRGGGEYGEKWHEQGMFEKKQNVFDDWFAAAQYLIDNKYTSPAHFAITGRSNGGLLMGASFTQHPELFAAVWCGYPLLDMLRYQKFEQGPQWTTEYGSAENEKQFPFLLEYSPYQNVKAGTKYPAIMFFTGDSDTRVDPLHARKMTPLVQSASTSGRPVLLHYSLAGGHSDGISVEQAVQDHADEMTFLWTESGR